MKMRANIIGVLQRLSFSQSVLISWYKELVNNGEMRTLPSLPKYICSHMMAKGYFLFCSSPLAIDHLGKEIANPTFFFFLVLRDLHKNFPSRLTS